MKKVLVISPIATHPSDLGNRERICSFLLALEKLDCEIFFAYAHMPDGHKRDYLMMKQRWKNFISIPYTYHKTLDPRSVIKVGFKTTFIRLIRRFSELLKLNYSPIFLIDEWYDNGVDNDFLKNLASQHRFDIVIVEYVFFSKALENFDNSTLKIIDTHDVFTDRQKKYRANKVKPSFFYTDSFNEKKGLERANRVIAIQDLEKSFFQEQLGLGNKVYTIGHFVELDNLFDPSLENNIVFFGSSNPINVKSINFFLEEVLPKIKYQIPDVNFLVGGGICSCLDENTNYRKLGSVEDKKLVYKQATIMVNPMLFGTGIKIKNVESLGYGIPLLTTSIGAEGLEDGINRAFLVADNAEEFAQKVIKTLSNQRYRLDLSTSAFQFAQDINNKNMANLKALLDLDN
jgi:glycosyltransferase involved in cell wall biosynthesis